MRPEVTIVMPAYNAAHFLGRSLPAAIAAARGSRVLVIDPGSDDGTPERARELGAEVVSLGHRAGPALARNRGVELVKTEVVLFIDSDCVAHPDILERVAKAFGDDPALVSLTGSYDDSPPERNFFSLYMNLRHHFTHQKARTEGASFWAGCGAVRTSVFRSIGGFDAEQFPRPMIEDIELGLRLRAAGRTCLDPAMHVKHLKHWSMRGVIETDIKQRALPWAELIVQTGQLPNDLNLAWSQRVAAAISPLVLLGLVSAPLAWSFGFPGVALAALLPAVVSATLHRALLAGFARTCGAPTALLVFLFHQVHLLYSAATLAFVTIRHALRGRVSTPGSPP